MPLQRKPRVLAMILAGGRGAQLLPLTEWRTEPSLPFGGQYRLIDFVLSNFLNSEILSVYVLVQYRSQSLIEHLRNTWRIGGPVPHFVTVVPPQMKSKGGWYEGTANAVYQNQNMIRDFDPDLVAIFGADHIYRIDVRQMVQFHLDHRADVTVASIPVPLHEANRFGVIKVETSGQEQRIIEFQEKPKAPQPIANQTNLAYCSMGNYLFTPDVLLDVLEREGAGEGAHEFGRDILPRMVGSHKILAYNFLNNELPGVESYEERGYWRDVGTLEAYWQANMDILGRTPIFDLRNRDWPIVTDQQDGPSGSIIRSDLNDVMIGNGSQVTRATLRRSVIGHYVTINSGANIEECVIMDGTTVGSNARLRRVIVDRFNFISDGTEIGFDPVADQRLYHTSSSGLVVIPRGRSMGGRAVFPCDD